MQANRKGLAINIEKDLQIPKHLFTDESRLEQILVNLLINAVKYTAKGTITIRIMRDKQQPDNLMFQVADTGIGLSHKRKVELFANFGNENRTSVMEKMTNNSN